MIIIFYKFFKNSKRIEIKNFSFIDYFLNQRKHRITIKYIILNFLFISNYLTLVIMNV